MRNRNIIILIYNYFIWILLGIVVISGCTRPDYKQQADEHVYQIIDEKWENDFGSKVNYKISDTTPSPNAIKVEKTIPESGILALPLAVAMATDHNREYQRQKETLYIKGLDLTLVRHEFENNYFGGGIFRYAREGADEGIGTQVEAGFNRLLSDGTTISTNIAASWAKILTGDLQGGLSSILSATIIRPLWRGSDRKVVQERLTQAERDTIYEIRSFNRFRKEFVVSVITQYYGVLQFFDAVENAEQNYRNLLIFQAKVQKLSDAGRVPRHELKRVEQEALQARDIFIQSRKDYEQALDELKITLSLPTDTEMELDVTVLEDLQKMMDAIVDFSESQAVDAAHQCRLDLANSFDAITDAERTVLVAADLLKGDLNLFAAAQPVSSERADLSRLRHWRDVFDVGAELNLPVDRLAERNIFRKAIIALNQSQREHEQKMDTVTLEVRKAYRNLSEAAERYKIQLKNLKLARKRLNNTLLLLEFQRSSSRRYLNAQDDFFDAENAATEAMVDYAIAVLEFYRDAGVLQVRPDGMWEVPANSKGK